MIGMNESNEDYRQLKMFEFYEKHFVDVEDEKLK